MGGGNFFKVGGTIPFVFVFLPFVKLIRNILVGNYELYHGYLRENIYNVICTICKCYSCCELKINFQNV